MFNPNDTRMNYDKNSYQEAVERSIFPGIYNINTPYNDCNECDKYIPNDPHIRYQNYGHNGCSMKKAIDDNSELSGRNYKNSKCNADSYKPNSYNSTGCTQQVLMDVRKCIIPTESCRLSNPPCSLKEIGINRFDPLCWNPQSKALESFDRVPVNYRMVAKDNHTPLIETPDSQEKFIPNGPDNVNNLNSWSELHKNNSQYSPGYPYQQANVNCKI